MKKVKMILACLFGMFVLTACAKAVEPDYTTQEAEAALNDGDDLEGKTVEITVDAYEPSGTLGYTIQTGEHLNVVSNENPKVKVGDTLVVKINKVENVLNTQNRT